MCFDYFLAVVGVGLAGGGVEDGGRPAPPYPGCCVCVCVLGGGKIGGAAGRYGVGMLVVAV